MLCIATGAHALGTASDTVLTGQTSFSVLNATASTPLASTNTTVMAVFGFATNTYTEEAAKAAAAGATSTYDFSIVNNGNATDSIRITLGAQAFGGAAGTTTEWAVAAEHVGVGMATFETSGGATASQIGDAATATNVDNGATLTERLYHHTAADASDGAFGSFSVTFETTDFPGAPYYGFNGTIYAGPTAWSRQLDSGIVITTVNNVDINATKTFAITAPAAYVGAGGGASDPIPGATLTYNITFSNDGAVAATTVIILDDIPTDTTFTPGSIQSCFAGAACTPAADPDTDDADPDCFFISGAPDQIQCDIATLSAGGGGRLIYEAVID